jgi:hypothetical protein
MSGSYGLVDASAHVVRERNLWSSIIVPRAAIEREVERLADSALPCSERRACAVSHPGNAGPVPGFVRGIDVTIRVPRPGRITPPIAPDSTALDMCLGGAEIAPLGARMFSTPIHGVWNTPSMEPVSCHGEGDGLFVRLRYPNAPLREKREGQAIDESPKRAAGACGRRRLSAP